jgi:methyl-accepting chemotaxis protein
MNSLRYHSKFALMASLVFVVIFVLLYGIFAQLHQEASVARQELSGVNTLKPLNRLVQAMQQHRGLSAGVLGGNETMRDKRNAKAAEVSKLLAETEGQLSETLRQSTHWQGLRSDWQALQAQGLSLSAPDNLKRHTQMIARSLILMIEVADDSTLTLDPAMDTYYLMDAIVQKMPALLEQLGLARGRGTGVLAKRELSPEMRLDLTRNLAEIGATLNYQKLNLDKVMRYAPATQGTLSGSNQTFPAAVNQVLGLVQSDILGEQFATPSQDYFTQVSQTIDLGYRTMQEVMMPLLETQLQTRIDHAERLLAFYIVLTLLVLCLLGYLAGGMYYSVLQSIRVFADGANRLASGDLRARFDLEGSDELHEAAHRFNAMADAIRNLLGRVQQSTAQLRSTARNLTDASQHMAGSASAQSDSASCMAAAVEEMTSSIDNIASSASQAQNASQESDRVAAQGGELVSHVVNEVRRIADTVRASANAVAGLGQQSAQISAIVGTIKEIADQTNLLALNAAIEAARAGESGRGFAVVADEVRKLAERTTKSTQEITDMIATIQTGTAQAVTRMQEGVEHVEAGVEQAQRAGAVIADAQQHSRHVAGAVEEISGALREQASSSFDLAQNVENIARMAESTTATARGNSRTAEDLLQLAEHLNQEVERFKT